MADDTAPGAIVTPPALACALCAKRLADRRLTRRGLCWTCYGKLSDCGIALPPKRSNAGGRAAPTEPLAAVVAILRGWNRDTRTRLAAALAVVGDQEAA